MTSSEKIARFEKALAQAGNTHTIGDVMQRIDERKAVCWTNGESIVITEVLAYPRLRACNFWLVVGNLHECVALQPAIDEWARGEGCSVATATGRMGWLRLSQLPIGSDWKAAGVKFVRELQR